MRGRKSNAAIRDLIIKTIRERPISFWDIKTKTELQVEVLKRHLQYLKELGVIEEISARIMGTPTKLWQIKHGKLLVAHENSLRSYS